MVLIMTMHSEGIIKSYNSFYHTLGLLASLKSVQTLKEKATLYKSFQANAFGFLPGEENLLKMYLSNNGNLLTYK